ncbi:MAG: carbohydrate ABC transporter substrate-binding protein, partial [Actinomyces ruminicola]|nr:carbohydrate ABC transporter substrate-binding protein [Actinomyces ruminicola]
YIGVDGEDKSGIALGTENYLSINSQASEADQQASIDFLNWLFTDAEGAKLLTDNSVVSAAPYTAFAELAPADPLGAEIVEYLNNDELYPINWVFQTYPSQDFKDQVGQHLAQYAAGNESWDDVKTYFVEEWKAEKSS